MEEQTIMESVNENLITIVCGETGSGKTTQIPQFLYEYGYANRGLIGITQPRRVAAISMASRISQEMNNDKLVSYQVRYENNLNAMTKIKFMTDGVLFKEISQDFLLKSYSVLIIDEAHERSLNTDIVIGLLSRIVKLRSTLSSQDENIYPLKLIVMSATLRIDDFVGPSSSNLFSPIPPVINVETRQFPVTVHFNRITNQNYVEEAFKKTVKIHTKLTQGGILIFLTGQNEINHLALKLRERFKCTSSFSVDKYDIDNCYISDNEDSIDDDPISDFEYQENELLESQSSMPLHILPLYSLLPTAEQMKVFQDPPPGSRLCVIATNVAETSITIPGIKYVIDSGKVKEKNYKFDSKLSSFDISWISKSSADQRKGRAGRNGPGHCYRLFSSAVFDHEFPQFSKPEIKRLPIESVYLELKSINIDNVLNFPFPSPPEKAQLREAEKLLIKLGALTEHDKRITSSGRKMAELPIAPRMARIVLKSLESNCVEYGICLAAALTVGDPFCRENVDGDKERTFQKTQRVISIFI
jgi:ATP-dependent RNA helicase DHX37/DHR1